MSTLDSIAVTLRGHELDSELILIPLNSNETNCWNGDLGSLWPKRCRMWSLYKVVKIALNHWIESKFNRLRLKANELDCCLRWARNSISDSFGISILFNQFGQTSSLQCISSDVAILISTEVTDSRQHCKWLAKHLWRHLWWHISWHHWWPHISVMWETSETSEEN